MRDDDGWLQIEVGVNDDVRLIAPITVGNVQLLLVRHQGSLVACQRDCPHEQADLSEGHCRDGRLHCPRHQASFDLETGEISAGWSVKPLRIYPVRMDGSTCWVKLTGSSPVTR